MREDNELFMTLVPKFYIIVFISVGLTTLGTSKNES